MIRITVDGVACLRRFIAFDTFAPAPATWHPENVSSVFKPCENHRSGRPVPAP
jgi:hypothetical protein